MLLDHKKGDVLQINIGGTITSCLVIEDLKEYVLDDMDRKDLMLYDLNTDKIEWFPKDPSQLENISYSIRTSAGCRRVSNAYRLLIGDQKVWFTYTCYDISYNYS